MVPSSISEPSAEVPKTSAPMGRRGAPRPDAAAPARARRARQVDEGPALDLGAERGGAEDERADGQEERHDEAADHAGGELRLLPALARQPVEQRDPDREQGQQRYQNRPSPPQQLARGEREQRARHDCTR